MSATLQFAYVAFDRAGKASSGVIESIGQAEAREALRSKGLFVTQLEESADGAAPALPGARTNHERRVGRGKVLKHLMTFTRQLNVLISSGTPLVQALGALERQAREPKWHAVVADLRKRVEEGASLSDAKLPPRVFRRRLQQLGLRG